MGFLTVTPFVVATPKSLGIIVFQVLGSYPLEILITEGWDEAPIADFFIKLQRPFCCIMGLTII